MYTRSLFIIVLAACLAVDCSTIRNNQYYAFIKYYPNGIQRNSTLLVKGQYTLMPYLNEAYYKLVEHKKYSIPMFVAMVTGLLSKFTFNSIWNLLPFKSSGKKGCCNAQLNTYKCNKCNYTIYPAKNRDEKFVGQKFTCPSCNAPYSDFTINKS